MGSKEIYTSKAEKYARFRWNYAPEAVEFLFRTANLTRRSMVADVGAGTGTFSRCFAGRVRKVYVIEPNDEMRAQAAQILQGPEFQLIKATAEGTGLRTRSVDLVTAAQAVHWFDPEKARIEFHRILKPAGWLAFLRNYTIDSRLNEAIGKLSREEYGVDRHYLAELPLPRPTSHYFAGHHFRKLVFPFSFKEDWEAFFGGLLSASYMPDETHALFPRLEEAAKEIFDRFSAHGELLLRAETELIVGRVG